MPPVLAASAKYTRRRHQLVAPVLARALSVWGTAPPRGDWDLWFAARAALLGGLVTDVQPKLIDLAAVSVPSMLDETDSLTRADGIPDAEQLVGVTGDGREIGTLLATAIVTARVASAKALVGPGMEEGAAAVGWSAGRIDMATKLLTITSDTARVASGLHAITHRDVGYVRRLVGASCGRCVVLAGRVYRSPEPFDRHPRCDCEHVLASARKLDLRTVDAQTHFDSLSVGEQDKVFTKAGAQAIRDGADVNQVVNARRGAGLSYASGRITAAEAEAIRNAGSGGRSRARSVTTEGSTKRGIAGGRIGRDAGGRNPRYQRLMPEAIYQAAGGDRDLALDLLYKHGYLMDRPGRGGRGGRTTGTIAVRGSRILSASSGGGGRVPPPPRGPFGVDLPDEYPLLPDGTAIPFTPATAPMPSDEDMRRVLDKHRSGATVPKKTHFPANWTDDDIAEALELTIRAPHEVIRGGDKLQFTRTVDVAIVRALIRTDLPGPRFWSGYPVRG